MSNNDRQPITRTCLDCRSPFCIDAGQQAWFERMDFALPRRSSACRQIRKLERERRDSSDDDTRAWEQPV